MNRRININFFNGLLISTQVILLLVLSQNIDVYLAAWTKFYLHVDIMSEFLKSVSWKDLLIFKLLILEIIYTVILYLDWILIVKLAKKFGRYKVGWEEVRLGRLISHALLVTIIFFASIILINNDGFSLGLLVLTLATITIYVGLIFGLERLTKNKII